MCPAVCVRVCMCVCVVGWLVWLGRGLEVDIGKKEMKPRRFSTTVVVVRRCLKPCPPPHVYAYVYGSLPFLFDMYSNPLQLFPVSSRLMSQKRPPASVGALSLGRQLGVRNGLRPIACRIIRRVRLDRRPPRDGRAPDTLAQG